MSAEHTAAVSAERTVAVTAGRTAAPNALAGENALAGDDRDGRGRVCPGGPGEARRP